MDTGLNKLPLCYCADNIVIVLDVWLLVIVNGERQQRAKEPHADLLHTSREEDLCRDVRA